MDMSEKPIVLAEIIKAIKAVHKSNVTEAHIIYDEEADAMHVNFSPIPAEESKMVEGNILFRYKDGGVVGLTLTNFSKWK